MGLAAHANLPFFCCLFVYYTITQKVSVPKKQGRVPPSPISAERLGIFFFVETHAKQRRQILL